MKNLMISAILCAILTPGCKTAVDSPGFVEVTRHASSLEVSTIPEELQNEAPAWARLGIRRIETFQPREGTDHRALIFDIEDRAIGSIELFTVGDVDFGPGTRRVLVRINGYHMRLELEGRGAYRLTDMATGVSGSASFDPEAKRFARSDSLDGLEQKFADVLMVTMGTLDAIDRRSDGLEPQKKTLIDATSPATSALWNCGGYWYRGGAYWGTRSGCCVKARYDAADQCTNYWCYGCCYYRPCDVWCSNGDYFCVCGVDGRACG